MIELVSSGRTPEELRREFEPTAHAIRNWVAQAERDEGQRNDGLTGQERQEPRRLRRENKAPSRRAKDPGNARPLVCRRDRPGPVELTGS
jgi:transposase